MADGGAIMTTGRALVLATARRLSSPFCAADVRARLSWIPRNRVSGHVHALARSGHLRRVGVMASTERPGLWASAFEISTRVAPPKVAGAAPDFTAANEAWRAFMVAGARFDEPITAAEARQLREIAGWQRD